MRPWCAVPTSEKFIVQLPVSAVVIRLAGARRCTEHVYVAKSAFFKGGASLSPNISQGRGRHPPTTVGVRKLERLPFRVVSKYPQCII